MPLTRVWIRDIGTRQWGPLLRDGDYLIGSKDSRVTVLEGFGVDGLVTDQ